MHQINVSKVKMKKHKNRKFRNRCLFWQTYRQPEKLEVDHQQAKLYAIVKQNQNPG
jgi:hypothetical protein